MVFIVALILITSAEYVNASKSSTFISYSFYQSSSSQSEGCNNKIVLNNCDAFGRWYWANHDGCNGWFFCDPGSSIWTEEINNLSDSYNNYFGNIQGSEICYTLRTPVSDVRKTAEANMLTLYSNIASGRLQLDALIAGAVHDDTDSFTRLSLSFTSTINESIVISENVLSNSSATEQQLQDVGNVAYRITEFYRSENLNNPKCIYTGCLENSDCDDGLFCNGVEYCVNNVCIAGNPPNCNDNVSCTLDSCNETTDSCEHTPDDSFCDDGLFCNGVETCDAVNGCQAGIPVDCSANNIEEINTCYNNPDGLDFTLDYRPAFVSQCVDESNNFGYCTAQTNTSISHTCDVLNCNAECDSQHYCQDTNCSHLNGCYDGRYYVFDNVSNSCLSNCTCEQNSCSQTGAHTGTDSDGDGWDVECGDCDDSNPNVHPNATEICDNIDNNCNNQIDEGFNTGDSCSAGMGQCYATGVYVCTQDGTGTVCNAIPGTPAEEICDGIDNDCDGKIDENLTKETSCGVGVCSGNTGTEVCDNGSWINNTCNPYEGASQEVCDNLIDEDCDGMLNNDCNCTYTEINRTCKSNNTANVSYVWNYHFCGNSPFYLLKNDSTCMCFSTETGSSCVSDGFANVSYVWNFNYCGASPYYLLKNNNSCSCNYTPWQNYACVGNGTMMQKRNTTSSFSYCDNTSRTIFSQECVICNPHWVCDEYSNCLINNYKECEQVYDTHYCGKEYDGNYSEFKEQCNYCQSYGPIISVDSEIVVYEGETVVLSPSISDNRIVTYTISDPVGNDGVWQTQKGDAGIYYVDVIASDNVCSAQRKVKIIVKKYSKPDLLLRRTLYSYCLRPGDIQRVYITLENTGSEKLSNVKINVFVYGMGIWKYSSKFDIPANSEEGRVISFMIPYYVEPGRYYMRITASNEKIRKVWYRSFDVI